MEQRIKAFHLGHRLKLSKLKNDAGMRLLKSDATYHFYIADESSFVYVKDFGAVVFINFSDDKIDAFLSLNKVSSAGIEEDYLIIMEPSCDMHIDFDKIYVPELNNDLLHIVCLNVAQSLALDQYQEEVDILLNKTRLISAKLKSTGRIQYTRKQLAKYIGEIMNLRIRIADNLYIFEAPPLAWQDPSLGEMDEIMNREFDFANRHRAIQHNLTVVKDNHEFFNNLLQHKHSSLLEWIIIVLILFEVVHILLK